MSPKHIILIILSLTLNYCATPDVKYQTILKTPDEQTTKSLVESTTKTKPTPVLLNKSCSSKMKIEDGVLSLENKPKSLYQLFLIDLDEGNYSLKLYSECSCFGNNKTIMVPVVYLFNKDGEEIKLENKETTLNDAGFTRAMYYLLTGTFTIKKKDSLYLLVTPDVSFVNKPLVKFIEKTSYYADVSRGKMVGDTEGDFDFVIEKKP